MNSQERDDFVVISKKFDGKEKLRWWFPELQRKPDYYLLETKEQCLPYKYSGKERQTFPYKTRLIFFPGKWFNIFIFYRPDGSVYDTYVNIAAPPIIKRKTISFIDLDLDVIVHPDKTAEVVDKDEFDENRVRYNYPTRYIEMAQTTVDEVLGLVENRDFPFDWEKIDGTR